MHAKRQRMRYRFWLSWFILMAGLTVFALRVHAQDGDNIVWGT